MRFLILILLSFFYLFICLFIYLFTYIFIIFLPLRNNFLPKEQQGQLLKMQACQWGKTVAELSNSYSRVQTTQSNSISRELETQSNLPTCSS